MEKKKRSGIKIAVRVTVFILLLGIFSVTGYEMYSTALEKKRFGNGGGHKKPLSFRRILRAA